jgi:hypothetical protein
LRIETDDLDSSTVVDGCVLVEARHKLAIVHLDSIAPDRSTVSDVILLAEAHPFQRSDGVLVENFVNPRQ